MSILQADHLKKYYGAGTNITKALDDVPSSGGRQRAAIARVFVSKPAILPADELNGNLDSCTSNDVPGLLKAASSKFLQTLVMITHNNEIAQLAGRIIRIGDGRIVK